ncbi:MAG: J domain-containing protein [Candidatus Woesearchaeota archaeon]|nr:MAG: J domain-containing protein [Candidatus Woesearchaeota archaeon]
MRIPSGNMVMISVRGHEFNALVVRDSFQRRAEKFKNNIIASLRLLGISEDDVDVSKEVMPLKRLPASASWYFDGYHLQFSYKAGLKYIDNLYVVSRVIELEVQAILEERKSVDEFINDFSEETNVEDERKAAREHLGLDADVHDLDIINKRYKLLAKDAHPDMPTGDTETFKKLNRAHKILKRELS